HDDHCTLHLFPTRRSSDLVTFSAGAALPLVVAAFAPMNGLGLWVAGSALLGLALLGALGAKAGGAPVNRSVARVVFWGALAMARSEEHTSELQSRENLVCR